MKVRKKFPSKVACVHCNGGCRANQSPEGYDLCLYGCTGCGACMEVCRFGAISLNSYGVAEVDESRCIGWRRVLSGLPAARHPPAARGQPHCRPLLEQGRPLPRCLRRELHRLRSVRAHLPGRSHRRFGKPRLYLRG